MAAVIKEMEFKCLIYFLKHAIRIHAALVSHPWLTKVLKKNESFKIQSIEIMKTLFTIRIMKVTKSSCVFGLER